MATIADKYDSSLGSFKTKKFNKQVAKLDKKSEGFMSPDALQNYYAPSNFDFKCPGNSFLIGIESSYKFFDESVDSSKHSGDRDFSFLCGFFEDPEDRLLRKINCENSLTPPDHKETQASESSCSQDSQFIHGLAGIRFGSKDLANTSNLAFSNDRIIKSFCCELNSYDGAILKSQQKECSGKTFKATTDFSFKCEKGKILKRIETAFDGQWDRSYTFQCCSAGI